ncbi:MAG: lipocalin-like domain-containing protein [Aggregatilineales bacterium]
MKNVLEQLVGQWRLVVYESRYTDGSVRLPMGEHPNGVLLYTAHDQVSVHMTRHDRQPFIVNDWLGGTDEEVRSAYESYIGYFGHYSVDENAGTVTHHIEGCSFQNWVGQDLVRYFMLESDLLTLTTDPVLMGGGERRGYLEWQRSLNVL